ncbi:MAG: aspartate--ammonia ligase [Clostridia bacterium]|nr:aspartate--ammonia ligase [Clostridia bacterium]
MSKVIIPKNYKAKLSPYDTQRAIALIHSIFEKELCSELDLSRVSAPLLVRKSTGLNDNLNGYERPVGFDILETGEECEVVHSLAKWKRQALKDYGFRVGKGLYTDMNAIRRDEEMDNIHSVYVDQWDWEKVIKESDRNLNYLKKVVQKIVNAICDTEDILREIYPELNVVTAKKRKVTFITSQELLDMYPDKTPKERENAFAKEHGTICIMQIGGQLSNGEPHDGRAPDYDDWDLNCDILFWNEILEIAFEVSSMGIRVSPVSLDRQLTLAKCEERRQLPFHKALLAGELPYTIGGGIGQSRLCMLLLGCAHIGETQSSVWDQESIDICKKAGIFLL